MIVARCRSCGAAVRWVKTEHGKRMPLDAAPAAPDARGLFVIRDDTAIAVPALAFPDEPNYVSHFATCPDADEWRHPTEGGTAA